MEIMRVLFSPISTIVKNVGVYSVASTLWRLCVPHEIKSTLLLTATLALAYRSKGYSGKLSCGGMYLYCNYLTQKKREAEELRWKVSEELRQEQQKTKVLQLNDSDLRSRLAKRLDKIQSLIKQMWIAKKIVVSQAFLISKKRVEIIQLNQKIEEIRTGLHTLKSIHTDQVTRLSEQVHSLDGQKAQLGNEKTALQENLQKKTQQTEALANEIRVLTQQIERQRAVISEKERTVGELQTSLAKSHHEIYQQNQTILVQVEQILSLQRKAPADQSTLERLQSEHSSRLTQLQAHNNRLHGIVLILADKLKQKEKKDFDKVWSRLTKTIGTVVQQPPEVDQTIQSILAQVFPANGGLGAPESRDVSHLSTAAGQLVSTLHPFAKI